MYSTYIPTSMATLFFHRKHCTTPNLSIMLAALCQQCGQSSQRAIFKTFKLFWEPIITVCERVHLPIECSIYHLTNQKCHSCFHFILLVFSLCFLLCKYDWNRPDEALTASAAHGLISLLNWLPPLIYIVFLNFSQVTYKAIQSNFVSSMTSVRFLWFFFSVYVLFFYDPYTAEVVGRFRVVQSHILQLKWDHLTELKAERVLNNVLCHWGFKGKARLILSFCRVKDLNWDFIVQ